MRSISACRLAFRFLVPDAARPCLELCRHRFLVAHQYRMCFGDAANPAGGLELLAAIGDQSSRL